MTSEKHKRKQIDSQAREMIASVYHFLREEYDFMKQNNFENCDLSPLSNVTKRTAQATGVSERTVSRLLREERESSLNSTTENHAPKKKRIKESKAKKKLQIQISDSTHGVSKSEELWTSKGSIVAVDHTVLKIPFHEELTSEHLAVCNKQIKTENKLRNEFFSGRNLIAENNNERRLNLKLRDELSLARGHLEQHNNQLTSAPSEDDQETLCWNNVDNYVTLQSIKPEYCKNTDETFSNNACLSLTVLA